MPAALALVDREDPITLDEALSEERNIINLHSYGPATKSLYLELWKQRSSIEAIVKHHLALGEQDTCEVLSPRNWIQGNFNVCVFVKVDSCSSSRTVIFRCPMPHKLAEARYPGSINEKSSCEVGAYIWVEENCPEIRAPHLFGFGFSDGRDFTHIEHVPFFPRIVRKLWRTVYRFLRLPLLSQFIQNSLGHQMSSAYMVLEYLGPETGQMLSEAFETCRESERYRERLFRGLSQIILSLARIPHARIGSFQFHNNGTITLTNRPLSCEMMILENQGAPRVIEKDNTFGSTDAFVSDMITFHDHRFLNEPNAVNDEGDCRGQMAIKALLRVFQHHHIKRELRDGPFLLQLTDLHQSNILVDEEGNVTGLIDLEWIGTRPIEMFEVPYWLTGCHAIDNLQGHELDQFDQRRREFMRIFEEVEQAMKAKVRHDITLSKIMHDVWESGGAWFWPCVSSVNAMYILLERHLCPPETLSTEAERILSRFWSRDSEDVVQKKLADKEAYNDELRRLFREL